MTIYSYFIGTAGSGKSTLVAAMLEWIDTNSFEDTNVIAVNLDPGVKVLPYDPNVDCRDYINIEDIMLKYNLGPNGGLIASMDLLVTQTPALQEEIESLKPDHVLVDIPGQMEVFAYRSSGMTFVTTVDPKLTSSCIVFLLDPSICRTPNGFISSLLLSASVQYRFFVPQIHVLAKSDLIEPEETEKIVEWSTDFMKLENDINLQSMGLYREMSVKFCRSIDELGETHEIIPLSSLRGEGMEKLYAEMSRILLGGSDFFPT
ncbi:MAG: ATP/GTP-binding protein [Candidatus Helarchaeota archaeon]